MGKGDKEARTEAQARLAAERSAQQAADKRRTWIFGGITVAVIVIIAVLVGVSVSKQSNSASDVGPLPRGADPVTYGIQVGATAINGGGDQAAFVKATTPKTPRIDFYEDFQCPACKKFEDQSSPTVNFQINNGKVLAVYNMLNFLDKNFNSDSSLRAANAGGCAADEGKFLIFHDTVYANQPKKEGAGFTDSDLLRFGNESGLTSPSFAKCVTTLKYRNWVVNGVQRAADNVPVTSTPTLRLNNRDLVRPISNQQIVNAIASLSK